MVRFQSWSLALRHLAGHADRVSLPCPKLSGLLLAGYCLVTADHEAGACGSKALRNGAPDATRSAGDQRHLAVQTEVTG